MMIGRWGALLVAIVCAAACGRTREPRLAAATDTVVPPMDTVVTGVDRFPPPTVDSGPPQPPRERTDRCRFADSAAAVVTYTQYPDSVMERGVMLDCALREGGPRARVRVNGGWGIPMGLDISYPGTAYPGQALALDNDERAYRGADLVIGQDLNDDGWTDLLAETFSGSGGRMYDVFTWNPRRHRFEQDSAMPTASNVHPVDGRACVQSTRPSGVALRYGAEFCWAGGGWHLVRRWKWEAQLIPEGDPVPAIRTTEEMRDGKVTRVRVDTLAESIHTPPDPPAAP